MIFVQAFIGFVIIIVLCFAFYTIGLVSGFTAAYNAYDGPAFVLYSDSLDKKVLRDEESVVN